MEGIAQHGDSEVFHGCCIDFDVPIRDQCDILHTVDPNNSRDGDYCAGSTPGNAAGVLDDEFRTGTGWAGGTKPDRTGCKGSAVEGKKVSACIVRSFYSGGLFDGVADGCGPDNPNDLEGNRGRS
mmetsp:Transcript_2979/g.3512  ORF Transcript_2979/g.3512 Transcript_2979/m.3512 type:complete len:125 (-) Transcript_2979:580-954(-)